MKNRGSTYNRKRNPLKQGSNSGEKQRRRRRRKGKERIKNICHFTVNPLADVVSDRGLLEVSVMAREAKPPTPSNADY